MSNVPPPSANLRGAIDLSALVNRSTAPDTEGGAEAASVDSLVFAASDATFQQVLELSMTVPVVVELVAAGIEPSLGPIVESYGGRLVLATVDASANPQVAQAFQVREVPAVSAVIGGRPLALFVGIPSDAEVRQVFDQVLQVAAQNGVTGTVSAAEPGEGAEQAEPEEEPLPPLHQAAYDALSSGDYAGAVDAYRSAIEQNPRDALAVAGLAQASLLMRLDGVSAGDVRQAAAERPDDVEAQLAVADLDMSGGHLDDAFDRLLELFARLAGSDRDPVRTRLLEYFEVAGPEDPRVLIARARLANLLY